MDVEFKRWCENEAVRLRYQLKCYAYDPLSAACLAEYFSIETIKFSEIPGFDGAAIEQSLQKDPSSWSAVTLTVPGYNPVIIYNPLHSLERHEANMMHEIAHLILNHNPVSISPLPGLPFLRKQFCFKDEEKAKYLGGCLQIPSRGLHWAIGRKMTQKQIADHFGASLRMVKYRLNMAGLRIKEPN